jgi:hypothetical protein
MENSLNKWFNAARQHETLLNIKEVEAMISQPPAVKGGFSIVQKGVFMLTIIGVILSFIFWFNPSSFTVSEMAQPQESNTAERLEAPTQLKENSILRSPQLPSKRRGQTHYKENNHAIKNDPEENQTVLGPSFSFSLNGTHSLNLRNDGFNHEEIELSNEELLKLGIRTDGNVLEYLNQYDTAQMHFDFDTKTTMVFALDLKISKTGGWRTNNTHRLDSNLMKYSNDAVPLLITRLSDEDNLNESFAVLQKGIPATKLTAFSKTMQSKLIPVKVKTKGQGVVYVHDNTVVFWYKNNPTFREKLPHWIAENLSQLEDFSEQELLDYIDELKGHAKEEADLYKPDEKLVKRKQSEFVQISNKELRKLHLKFNGKKLGYKVFSYDIDSHLVVIDLAVTPDIFNQNNNHGRKRVKLKQTEQFVWYITDSNLNIDANFIDPISQVGNQEANEQRIREQGKFFLNRLDSLIPILVTFSPDALKQAKYNNPATHLVIWFPKSEELLKSLPKREQKKLGVDELNIQRNQATPLKYIELTDEQLVKFGIKRNPESITVPMHTGNGHYIFSDYSSKGSVHHFNRINQSTDTFKTNTAVVKMNGNLSDSDGYKLINQEPMNAFYPSAHLITEGNGLHWLAYQLDDELSEEDQAFMIKNKLSPLTYTPAKEARKIGKAKLIDELNSYIALKVKSNETPSGGANTLKNPDLIIWYKPDSLLFATLPELLAKQIKDELDNISNKNEGASCQFFEVCQSNKGTIGKCILYPNPAAGLFQIDIELGEARQVSIYLTDISGKKIKDISILQTQENGLHTYKAELSQLSDGMYLVHITTDKGEYIVQRLMKKG